MCLLSKPLKEKKSSRSILETLGRDNADRSSAHFYWHRKKVDFSESTLRRFFSETNKSILSPGMHVFCHIGQHTLFIKREGKEDEAVWKGAFTFHYSSFHNSTFFSLSLLLCTELKTKKKMLQSWLSCERIKS